MAYYKFQIGQTLWHPESSSVVTITDCFESESIEPHYEGDNNRIYDECNLELRHPSLITLEEFIHLAKLTTPGNIFYDKSIWKMSGGDSRTRLYSDRFRYTWHLNYFDLNTKGLKITQYANGWAWPNFQQSLEIAEYLDSTGIRYKADSL